MGDEVVVPIRVGRQEVLVEVNDCAGEVNRRCEEAADRVAEREAMKEAREAPVLVRANPFIVLDQLFWVRRK
jgi:hypothetical protein